MAAMGEIIYDPPEIVESGMKFIAAYAIDSSGSAR